MCNIVQLGSETPFWFTASYSLKLSTYELQPRFCMLYNACRFVGEEITVESTLTAQPAAALVDYQTDPLPWWTFVPFVVIAST